MMPVRNENSMEIDIRNNIDRITKIRFADKDLIEICEDEFSKPSFVKIKNDDREIDTDNCCTLLTADIDNLILALEEVKKVVENYDI